ncbi:MAG TPA: DNA-3-methyladenine glycosylase [Longimicrobiales bacterium]|nr:DNA-3-methyladenine glycosylase [Longimicrobiales bacterium]
MPGEPAPWLCGAPPDERFPAELMECSVLEAARGLLGSVLVSTVDDARAVAVIVETEAYAGPDDPASHAATLRGRTERNRAMFGPSGRAYVYRSYGMHWCMNVVTGEEGVAQAVLLRGIEALQGVEVMERRRGGVHPLGAGPGRLSAALGITHALYGHDLRSPPLVLARGWTVPHERVGVSRRVGVSAAADRPHRFYVRGSPGVSRPDGWGA